MRMKRRIGVGSGAEAEGKKWHELVSYILGYGCTLLAVMLSV